MAIELVNSPRIQKEVTVDFPSIAANSNNTQNVTIKGLKASHMIKVQSAGFMEAGLVYQANYVSADTLGIRVNNCTAGAIDPASRVFKVVIE